MAEIYEKTSHTRSTRYDYEKEGKEWEYLSSVATLCAITEADKEEEGCPVAHKPRGPLSLSPSPSPSKDSQLFLPLSDHHLRGEEYTFLKEKMDDFFRLLGSGARFDRKKNSQAMNLFKVRHIPFSRSPFARF